MASVSNPSTNHVLETIHEQLLCAICLERLSEPKLLKCLHSFCAQCLDLINKQEPKETIACPTCRLPTEVPENDVYGLRTNFFINSLLDVMQLKFEETNKEKKRIDQCDQCKGNENATSRCIDCELILCDGCGTEHKRLRVSGDHRIISMEEENGDKQSIDQYTLLFCRYHTRNVIKYFCNTCDEAVCRVCTILEHREHQFVYPKEAMPQQRPAIESLLIKTKERIPKLRESLAEIERMQSTLKECRETIENEINAKTQARIDALLFTKSQLITKLDSVYQRKNKVLDLQADGIQLELGKLSGCCSFAENVLGFGNEVEILQVKAKLYQLSNVELKLDPEEDDSIQYLSEPDSVKHVMNSLGKIYSSQTFASLSYADGSGLETARVGVENIVTIYAQNRHGKKTRGGDRINAVLVSPDESRKALTIKDNDNGTYTISFIPEINGRHTLHIGIQDKPIKNSPFQVMVINRREYDEVGNSVLKFGQYGSKRREFKSPFGVACDSEGFMYVADSYNHRIQMFGPRGEFVNTIGSHGDRKGEFNCPTDVAVSPNNQLIVCDNGNNRVQIFTKSGSFVGRFGREGVKNGNFKSPWGIAVSQLSNEIIVADTDNHRIQIFSNDGKFIMKFGSQGERSGQFNSPCYIAVNPENENIFVSDSKNHRIQIFDPRGKFIQAFGSQGQLEGQFNHPRGLSMDIANNVIVSDMGNHRLQVLTHNGRLIKTIGSEGNGDGQLSFPESVAVNPNGYIVVSDLSNNRIQMF